MSFKPTKYSKVQKHLKGHFNRAVQHEGNIGKHLFSFFFFLLETSQGMCYQAYTVVGYSRVHHTYIDGVAPAETSNISFYDYAKRLINEVF